MGCFGLENVLSIGGCTTTNILLQGATGWNYKVGTGDYHLFTVNAVDQLKIDNGTITILNGNAIVFDADGGIGAGIQIGRDTGGALKFGTITAGIFSYYINGNLEYSYNTTTADFKGNVLAGVGITITGDVTTNILQQDSDGWLYQVGTGDSHIFTVNAVGEFMIDNGSVTVLNGNALVFDSDGGIGAGVEIGRDAGGIMQFGVPTGKAFDFFVNGSPAFYIYADRTAQVGYEVFPTLSTPATPGSGRNLFSDTNNDDELSVVRPDGVVVSLEKGFGIENLVVDIADEFTITQPTDYSDIGTYTVLAHWRITGLDPNTLGEDIPAFCNFIDSIVGEIKTDTAGYSAQVYWIYSLDAGNFASVGGILDIAANNTNYHFDQDSNTTTGWHAIPTGET